MVIFSGIAATTGLISLRNKAKPILEKCRVDYGQVGRDNSLFHCELSLNNKGKKSCSVTFVGVNVSGFITQPSPGMNFGEKSVIESCVESTKLPLSIMSGTLINIISTGRWAKKCQGPSPEETFGPLAHTKGDHNPDVEVVIKFNTGKIIRKRLKAEWSGFFHSAKDFV
ncbi:MAG: hypothetical protein PHQ35_01290 [Phycisphaerae bacterium]|nr:hypothetical protein [Phycisphaerae bacterium]MDD5381740.1 hypothetical protein [Phycisphaerae bacterium]